MSQAIWILQYDLKSGSEHEYLNWFHNIHIPEKLARPGYLWAVHYQGQIGALNHSENRRSYLALFGGVSTRTFLDPSPRLNAGGFGRGLKVLAYAGLEGLAHQLVGYGEL